MTAYKLTSNSTTKLTLIESNGGTDDSLDTNGFTLAPTSGNVPVTLTLANAPAAGGIVINNSGTITATSARAIDVGTGANATVTATGAKITLNNSGTLQSTGTGKGDLFRVNFDMPQGTIIVNNTGTMKTTINSNDSQGIRLGKVYTASQITITNGSATASASANANALIQTNDADAIRAGGVNPMGINSASAGSSVIVNYGKIIAQDFDAATTLTAVNAIDIGQGQSANVDNFGTIIGDESGLGADVGYNGPPNYSATGGTLTFAANYIVTNETTGTITGNNGAAIASGTATITNSGTITGKATGIASANAASTTANPTITNANGTGILTSGTATITNNATGVIQGTGAIGTAATSTGVNINNGTVTNYGIIRETATAANKGGAAVYVSGTTGSTVTNYGTITSAAGLAITMGGGADTINLYTGGTINGTIDGGAGADTLTLNMASSGAATGTLSAVANIETLNVNSGSWTITDTETYGAGVTIASGASLTIGPNGSTNATIVDNGTLTYAETGSFTKSQPISGTGKVVQAGTGTLVLSNSGNTYSGGTSLQSGSLDVAANGAAGTGAITFATGAQTLDIEQAALNGDGSFSDTLANFGAEDTIDLRGVGTATGASFDSSTNKLTITGSSQSVTLQLDGAGAPASGYAYGVLTDGNGGTLVALDQIATVQNITSSPSSGYVKAGQTIFIAITTTKAVMISGAPPVLNLQGGGTATYDATRSTATRLVFKDVVAQGQDASGVVVTGITNAGSVQDAYDVPVDFSGAVNQPAIGPTIDTTAPTVSITSMGGLTNQATQTVSGTVDAADNGTTVTVYEVYNGTTNVLGTAPVANGTWQTTVNLSTGNGTHTIYATDTDAAGNTGTSASVPYDLETTAPPVSISSAGGLTNQTMQTVQGSVDIGADPEAIGTTVTVTDTGTGAILGTGTVANDGSFAVNVTLTGDGTHTLQAGDTDQAGNSGFASVTYTLDTTAPAAPSAVLANDTGVSGTDKITSDPTITYKATASGDTLLYKADNGSYSTTVPTFATDGTADGQHTVYVEEQDAAGNISAAGSLTFTLDTIAPTTAPGVALANDTGTSATDKVTNDPTITYTAGTSGDTLLYKVGNGGYSTSVPTFGADGTYTVSVEEEDAAGNIGPASSLTFTLDTTPPAAPSVSLANDTGVSNADKITSDSTINYTPATPGDTLLYKVGNGTYSSAAPTFGADGTYTVSTEEVDAAGNIGPAKSLTFTLDTTAPDVDFTSMGGNVNKSTQIVNGMVGVEDAGTTVSIYEDGGTTAVATAVVNSSGYFSATVALGANGTHTLTATDTDLAGNVGATDVALTYNVDTTAPTFTAGNLVISISGNGDGSGDYGDNQATPLVLQQITTDGTYVSQIVLPQTTTTVNGVTESVISAEYGSSSEGSLQLSADGHSLVIAGYGVNAQVYNAGGAAVYGNAALAQSTSLQGGQYTAVPRVIADINANGTIDTSTSLYNVYNGNNPRSVATIDGSSFYISGQGVKGDTTQGVFLVQDGATTVTRIDQSTDTRTAVIYNGQLYVSRDSKQGSGGTSNIAVYGPNLPTGATKPTILESIDKSVVVTAATGNTVNGSSGSVNLDPNNFFFANANTLYVADGGIPKQGGVGDGGLQKWTFDGTTWTLQYTLSQGLGIVQPGADEGTTGLIGLTGRLNADGTVELYATNQTVGDTDQKYVFAITDQLGATTNAGNSFTTIVTAAPDTNIRGISFAPTAIIPTVALANDTGASATDGVTSNPTLNVTPAISGDTLLYSVDGSAYTSTAPTFATDGSQDGTHTVSVEERDKGGAIGPASSLTFTLDTAAPGQPSAPVLTAASDTGASATDGITNVAAPTFTGAAEAGTTVKLYDGTRFIGSAVADSSGTYTITSSKLGNGQHSFTVTATDAAGNVSTASAPSSVTIDTIAPLRSAAPTLTAASDTGSSSTDNITALATPTLTGTAEAGSTVTLYDGTIAVGTAIAGSNGLYSVTSSTLSDGAHALTVTTTDAAGNVSPASPARTITIDTAAPATPAAPTLTAASDTGTSSTDGITSNATPTLTGTAEAGATVTLYEGTTVLGTAVAASNGTYSVTSSTLPDGAHTLTVTATDKAGNVSTVSAGLGITIDTSAPDQPAAPTLTAASDSGSSSTDGITSVTMPTVTGTAEAGSTVKLYDGTRVLGTAVATSSGAYSITSAALANGTHALTVTATDVAGNISTASAALNVTIDTMAPGRPTAPVLTAASDSGSSATDGITNVTAPTVSGTAEAGSTVKLYDGARYLGTVVADSNGTYTITSSANLSNAAHSLTVTATDVAGNVSAASVVSTVTIDTVAPSRSAAPSLTAASDTGSSSTDNVTSVATPILTGTAEGGSTVTLYDGSMILGTAVAAKNGAYSITSSTLTDGVHTLTITATDAAGNVGPASPGRTVTIDTSAPSKPSAPTLAAASNKGTSSTDGITSNATPKLTGTAEVGSTVTLYDGSAVLGTAVTAANGTYSVTSAALADGAHTLTVTATDKAGNISALSTGRTITIDTAAPTTPAAPTLTTASDTGSSSTDGLTGDTTPTVTGMAEAGSTVKLYDGTRLLGAAVAASNGNYSITSAALANGTHALTVTATDVAGNISTASAALNVTIDTTAPGRPAAPTLTAASDSGSSSTDGVTNVSVPTLTGTAEAGSTVKLYDGTRYIGTATTGSNGTYSVTSATTLGNGTHALTVTATDAAGNVSAMSAASSITIDTVAPTRSAAPTLTAASDAGASSTDGITSDATPTLTGKAEVGATVTLYDGTTAVGMTVAKSDGTYSINSSTLADGAHALTVTATDAAGNVGAASPARNVTIDTAAPTVAIGGSEGTVTKAAQTISGTGEAGTSITLTDNGNAIGTKVTVGSDGTWSERINLSSGTNRIVANDTDKAGNVGTSQAVVYNYGASSAAQMSSLHSMVQAMSTMTSSSSASMTPTGSASSQEAHPLAAAHA